MKTNRYTLNCKNGEPTSSSPCFAHFGKRRKGDYRHKNIIGEVIKRTENNSLGTPEKKVLIVFTANKELSQEDIINELKKGVVKKPFK